MNYGRCTRLGRAALVRWRISTVLPASEQERKDLPQINGRAGRALALSDPARPRGHSAPKPSGGQDEPLVFAGNQRTDVRLYRASCLTVQRDLSAMGFSVGNNSSDIWEGIPGVRAMRVASSRGGREAGYVPFVVQAVDGISWVRAEARWRALDGKLPNLS